MADEDEINQNKICFEEIHFFSIVSQTITFIFSNFPCLSVNIFVCKFVYIVRAD